jgi:hypothetical protein
MDRFWLSPDWDLVQEPWDWRTGAWCLALGLALWLAL